MADTSGPNLQASFQLDLEKANKATENAKAKAKLAAKDMFQLYTNLLFVDAKYGWWADTIWPLHRPARCIQERT